MLVLSRKPNESIIIDGRIAVSVLRVDGETVRLGVDAPLEIPVLRKEIYEEIKTANQHAVGTAPQRRKKRQKTQRQKTQRQKTQRQKTAAETSLAHH